MSRIEELSRDVLAKDGCGVLEGRRLNLTREVLEKAQAQFDQARGRMGGNRFVDELQFHHVQTALRKHLLWRRFLNERLAKELSDPQYKRLYNLTEIRNKLMHGRVLFPTYPSFREFTEVIDNIAGFIDHLNAYVESSAKDAGPAV